MSELPKYLTVEFPGVVANETRALECLGGLPAVAAVSSHSMRRLPLRFRANGPAVDGDVVKVCNVIVKVRHHRRRRKDEDAEAQHPVPTVTVVGLATRTVRYSRLFDYTFLPAGPGATAPIPTAIAPPRFSRIDQPTALAHRPPLERAHHRRVVRVGPDDAPPTVPPPDIPQAGVLVTPHVAAALVPLLESAFAHRPIYTRAALLRVLPSSADFAAAVGDGVRAVRPLPLLVSLAIGRVAFEYTSGPWRSSYCAYGYDPAADVNATRYQTVQWRVTNRRVADDVRARALGTATGDDDDDANNNRNDDDDDDDAAGSDGDAQMATTSVLRAARGAGGSVAAAAAASGGGGGGGRLSLRLGRLPAPPIAHYRDSRLSGSVCVGDVDDPIIRDIVAQYIEQHSRVGAEGATIDNVVITRAAAGADDRLGQLRCAREGGWLPTGAVDTIRRHLVMLFSAIAAQAPGGGEE